MDLYLKRLREAKLSEYECVKNFLIRGKSGR